MGTLTQKIIIDSNKENERLRERKKGWGFVGQRKRNR